MVVTEKYLSSVEPNTLQPLTEEVVARVSKSPTGVLMSLRFGKKDMKYYNILMTK